jgi:hypothetical protein
LIEGNQDVPLPSWHGIEWLLEDHGLSMMEEKSWNLLYHQVRDSSWKVNPPLAVSTNGHFSNFAWRYSWAPDALLNSVKYNP